MSLHSHIIAPVPEETVRVARAAFPKGIPISPCGMRSARSSRMRTLPPCSLTMAHPGLPPWRLALVTIMQFRENLADRQAAEAVRARIDWKYLLRLELTDPGFDFSVLSEFRDRLLAGSAEELLLDEAARALSGAGPGSTPGAAAHRLDACARRDPRAQSARTGGGNPPGRLKRGGDGRARLAPSAHPAGVVRAL